MNIRGYEFKNYTPHEINLILNDEVNAIPSEGEARVGEERQNTRIDFIKNKKFTNVTGLPEREDGVFYIVSGLVFSACRDRCDLVVPDLLCRDEKGKIIGCMGFYK